MVKFIGSCHPKGIETDGQVLLTDKEIDDKCKTLPGTPILHEHQGYDTETGSVNQKLQVGTILASWKDKKTGQLMVMGDIPKSKSLEACSLARKLKSGDIKGMSLGMEHFFDIKTNRVVDKKVNEVTITSDPDLWDSNVYVVEDDDAKFKKVKQVLLSELTKSKKDTYKSTGRNSDVQERHNTISVMEQQGTVANSATSVGGQGNVPQTQQTPVQSQTAPQPPQQEHTSTITNAVDKVKQATQEYSQSVDYYDRIARDPEALGKFLAEKKMKKKRKLESMQKDALDYVVSTLKDAGIDPEFNTFYQDIKNNAAERPTDAEPLMKFITVAHQTSKKRMTEYQSQISELQKKTTDYENRINELQKKDQIRSTIPSNQYQQSQPAPASGPAAPQQQQSQPFEERWQGGIKLPNLNFDITGVPFQNYKEIPEVKSVLNVFSKHSIPKGTGMERVDYKGVVGFDYGFPKEGIVTAHDENGPPSFFFTNNTTIKGGYKRPL